MLSQTAEYALRAALFLGRHGEEGPIPSERIAEGLGAPRNYLSKTLHELAKRGVVEGVRGPNGGFRLAVPADQLTLFELVGHFDELNKREMCLLGARPCDSRTPCAAHDRWTRVAALVAEPLRTTTVADLLSGGLAQLSAAATPSTASPAPRPRAAAEATNSGRPARPSQPTTDNGRTDR